MKNKILYSFLFFCYFLQNNLTLAIPHYYYTSSDERHYHLLKNLIGSIHHVDFKKLKEIAVFDLGLTPKQRAELSTMAKVAVYDVEMIHPDLLTYFVTYPDITLEGGKTKYIKYKKKWSILIPTLKERKKVFQELYTKLTKQIKDNNLENVVEIVVLSDNRTKSIGQKRNELLEQSTGEYICFVDDDDDIHEHYIEMIYNALLTNPDCVNLIGIKTTNGKQPRTFIHSIKYTSWFEKDFIYYRPPNHLNTIRRDIAIKFKFPEKNHGEDADWSMQIAKSGLLKKEALISEPYYFYRFLTKK